MKNVKLCRPFYDASKSSIRDCSPSRNKSACKNDSCVDAMRANSFGNGGDNNKIAKRTRPTFLRMDCLLDSRGRNAQTWHEHKVTYRKISPSMVPLAITSFFGWNSTSTTMQSNFKSSGFFRTWNHKFNFFFPTDFQQGVVNKPTTDVNILQDMVGVAVESLFLFSIDPASRHKRCLSDAQKLAGGSCSNYFRRGDLDLSRRQLTGWVNFIDGGNM